MIRLKSFVSSISKDDRSCIWNILFMCIYLHSFIYMYVLMVFHCTMFCFVYMGEEDNGSVNFQ